jgi:hypothetical protein
MAKKSKKRKSIKKYAVGGDMRVLNPLVEPPMAPHQLPDSGQLPMPHPGPGPLWPPRPGGGDDSATGQVKQISDSARRAADFLGGAGRAQQEAGKMLGNVDQGGRPPWDDVLYKKGGKVKKSAKTRVKVRGAGKAVKGVRPAKMVKMKGS